MPSFTSPIVGTIAMLPGPYSADRRSDDTSLGGLLASLAQCASLEIAAGQPPSLVASTRLTRFTADDLALGDTIQADVERLAEDLQQEYQLLASR